MTLFSPFIHLKASESSKSQSVETTEMIYTSYYDGCLKSDLTWFQARVWFRLCTMWLNGFRRARPSLRW